MVKTKNSEEEKMESGDDWSMEMIDGEQDIERISICYPDGEQEAEITCLRSSDHTGDGNAKVVFQKAC